MCMGGLIEDPKAENNPESWDVNKQPYRVYFKDISGLNQNCYYCDSRRCDGCPVPYINDLKVKEIFEKLKMDSNETLFEDDMTKGKEFQVTVVRHQDISHLDVLFACLTAAFPFVSKQPEVLEAEKMQYCANCKEHVAVKDLKMKDCWMPDKCRQAKKVEIFYKDWDYDQPCLDGFKFFDTNNNLLF